MTHVLVISPPELIERDGVQHISALIGEDRIWFEWPARVSLTPVARVEPFVAVALLEAMCTGADIELPADAPLSEKLSEQLPQLQAVYHSWNKRLHKVAIHARLDQPQGVAGRVGSYYSAGVDSSFSLLRHRNEITHLFAVDAFDDPVPLELWQAYVTRQQDFAERFGKVLAPIRTNVRQYAEAKRISWEFMHGLVLATLGNFFGCSKVYVPSSYTYRDLFPWGSHPLTDSMWSTDSCQVVHDGADCQRWEKVAAIAGVQDILDNLHVCWRNKLKNCGHCSKCVRTMVALHLLGARSDQFPPFAGVAELKSVDAHEVAFLRDAMLAAKKAGDQDIYRRLRKLERKYERLQLVEAIDKTLLGGVVRRLYRRIKKPAWLNSRVVLESQDH